MEPTDAGSVLSADLAALLERRPPPGPAAVAESVRRVCETDHVAIVDVRPGVCSVLAAAGPELLTGGTSSPPEVSTRLLAVSQGRVWESSDLQREEAFDRPIDQMALAVGFRSGAGVPLVVRGETVGAVLLSSRTRGRRWEGSTAAVGSAAGLLVALLGLAREPLRVVVVHPDPLTAQGLARLVEQGLAAEVEVAVGPWDPRLDALMAEADAVVVDSSVEVAGQASGVVVVHDGGPPPAAGIAVDRRAAVATLAAAVARASGGGTMADRPLSTGPALSAREFELLRELAAGRPYKDIATRLRLSVATVRSYSRGLYAKLDVHSRGEAVARAVRAGLIEV